MLQEGVYDLTSGMTEMCSAGMLCLEYAVTIEAEVAGAVVLDAARSNGVLYITGTDVELIGLNITGGYSSYVSGRCRTHALMFKLWNLVLIHSARFFEPNPSPRWKVTRLIAYFCMQGGGVRVYGSASFIDCNLYDNEALQVRARIF